MKISFNLLVLLLLVSCQKKVTNEALVEDVFRKGQLNIITELDEIQGLSENYYNNSPDSLIGRIEKVIELRRNAGIKLGNKVSNINYPLLLPYLDSAYLQLHLFRRESDRENFKSIIQHTKRLLQSSVKENDLLEILVSVNTIDGFLLSAVRGTFSDGHELLKFEFFFHQNSKPKVNVPFKVFICPQFALPPKWNVTIDSVSLKRNGVNAQETYLIEKLGSVAYFQFSPKLTGKYELTGIYTAGIKEEFFEESGEFKFAFEVN